MSHRVTTETEMKDKELVKSAAKTAGISYQEQGANQIRFTSGGLREAVLNLTTGQISGDTDYGHSREGLGALRQAYGEAKYRYECTKQGISINSRSLDREGNIVLMCSVG